MYQFKEDISIDEFEAFVNQHPLKSFMQHIAWARVKKEWNYRLLGIYRDSILVGGALLLIRGLPLGLRLGYMPRGPLLDFEDDEMVACFFKGLKKVGKNMHMISIKFDPNIFNTYDINQKDEAKAYKNGCKHLGYNEDMYAATQARFQLCYYKKGNVMDSFSKKTRDKIKTAMKYHVEIEEKHLDGVNAFYEMTTYTEKRKGIVLRSSEYYQSMLEAYPNNSIIYLAYLNQKALKNDLLNQKYEFEEKINNLDSLATNKRDILNKQLARVNKELKIVDSDIKEYGERVCISGLLLLNDNETTELLYSGLNEHFRQYLSAYLLRYHGIEWAFKQNCKAFNFGGVQGNLSDGLFEFKSAFNPSINAYIGEFDYVINYPLFVVMNKAIPLLKKVKMALVKKG